MVPLDLAGTAGATASPACRAHNATVYVVNQGSGTVTPIRTATYTADKEINVLKDPYDIAITPNGRTAYVVNNGSNTVTPVSTVTGKAGKPISVGSAPVAIAIMR